MKTPYLAIVLLAATFLSCKKHVISPPVNQLSLLPPATQTGANTFGCLINGQAFLPQGNIFSAPKIECYYEYVAGEYALDVAANDKINSNLIKSLVLETDSLAVSQGGNYVLKAETLGNASATYTIFPQIGETQFSTTNSVIGNLTITKLDTIKQIVSGTFYFNAINIAAGDTIKVTNGRFDLLYTK